MTTRSAPQTIVYMAYGEGRHMQETIVSLLTALRLAPPNRAPIRYAIYTDNPGRFRSYPVETILISHDLLDAWMNGGTYIHRRKTMVILDALRRFSGKVAFVDSDTYFLKSPQRLFDLISDKSACLHVMEGPLNSGEWHSNKLLQSYDQRPLILENGAKIAVEPKSLMWNPSMKLKYLVRESPRKIGIRIGDISRSA